MPSPIRPSVLWFRRDLRLHDHPALLAAAAGDTPVLPLFVLDPALLGPAGRPRTDWLLGSLAALAARLDSHLVVRTGNPVDVVPQVAREAGADAVHISADAGPYGRRRDREVARALAAAGARLVATGTPYAVGPGTLLTGGRPFTVYTPFARAWQRHGWPDPAPLPDRLRWATRPGDQEGLPEPTSPVGGSRPGEEAARERWAAFLDGGLDRYAGTRDRPDLNTTSQLSAHLKFGELHPRTLLRDLADRGPAASRFRAELCWREFYADVLWHHPSSARSYLRPQFARMTYDPPGDRLAAWAEGRTGYPLVDAGMRQLASEAWMHNRVRMVTASFLVKDLHIEWQHGARVFMDRLRDGDLASNQHGWQWVAGSGTDAAPYPRVFNPVTQGQKFDPSGDYVRRHVPELQHLAGAGVHEPWNHPEGYAHGYPERMVDHAAERAETLSRYAELSR